MDTSIRAWIDLLPDPVCATDVNHNILYMNNEAVRLTGAADAEEFLGKQVSVVFGRFESEVQERTRTESFEARGVDHLGRTRWFLISVADIPSQPPVRIFSGKDITERKQMERVLYEGEQRFRKIAGNIPGIVAEFRTGSGDEWISFDYVGPQITRHFGITPEEIVIEPLALLARIPKRYRAEITGILETPDLPGMMVDFQFPLSLREGGDYWFHTFASLSGISGGMRIWSSVTLDITRIKLLEANLSKNRANLRAFIDNAKDAMASADREGRLQFINREFQQLIRWLWGVEVGKGMIFCDFVPGDTLEAAERVLERVILGGRFNEEFSVSREDGFRTFRVAVNPIREEREIIGVSVIIHDLTEIYDLQNRVFEASRMEQKRIGQELHDGLCQELGGVAFLSQVLTGKLRKNDYSEAEDAEKIYRYIDGILTQTRRISGGLYPVLLEEEGLVPALQELAMTTSTMYGIRCECAAEEGTALREPSRAIHLYRIVQEALNNAVRHGEAEHVVIEIEESGTGLSVRIRDNGRGFDTRNPGKGMGLKTMENRSRFMGGRLEVKSGRRGTTVECHVPA